MTFNRDFPRTPVARTAALAACLALAGGAAVAADPSKPAGNAKFEQLDRNRDGFISREETRGIRDYGRAFTEADANKDGKLDAAEFVTAESIHDRITAGKYVEDSVLTAKVKTALLKEPDLKSLDVSVESLRGEVLLSGFVKDEGQRQKALKAATAVNGVASVKDALVVR